MNPKFILPIGICSLEMAAHVASFVSFLEPYSGIIGMVDGLVIAGYFYFMIEDTKQVRN